ncbi:hypothetical protein ACIBF1_21715 [Spirillospora sp. NPDC050679]
MVARHFEKVGADGVQAVVARHPGVVVQGGEQVEPRPGPRVIAIATAWLSVTIGLGATRDRIRYSTRICSQSVSSTQGARTCRAAIAAWSW